MVSLLSGRFDFLIVTLDRDFGDHEAYPSARPNEWVQVGMGKVLYMPKRDLRIATLVRIVQSTKPDVLYANSFFSRTTIRLLVARRLGWLGSVPMVLAPRGEFSPGALKLRQGRKRTFLALGSRLGLFRNLLWQASTEFERDDILRAFGSHEEVTVSRSIAIAPDLFEPHDHRHDRSNAPKTRGRARFVFLSRISPKKNLRTAIELIGLLSGDVSLDIYGGIDDQRYWRECQAAMSRVGPGIRTKWHGYLEPNRVIDVFAGFDFFVFPTLGENFGHVILESLRAGCPVVLSDTTPWKRIEADGAGWVLPLAQRDRWGEVLRRCVDMDEESHVAMREGARSAAHRCNDQESAVQQNVALFEAALRMHSV
jgi:glycosyltransferase involved in cell wall biosynthesis